MAVQKTPRRPDTYRETLHVLGKFGVIDSDLAGELSKLAGFRNILVHEYTALDVKEVWRILSEDYGTMDTFRKVVREFVKEKKLSG